MEIPLPVRKCPNCRRDMVLKRKREGNGWEEKTWSARFSSFCRLAYPSGEKKQPIGNIWEGEAKPGRSLSESVRVAFAALASRQRHHSGEPIQNALPCENTILLGLNSSVCYPELLLFLLLLQAVPVCFYTSQPKGFTLSVISREDQSGPLQTVFWLQVFFLHCYVIIKSPPHWVSCFFCVFGFLFCFYAMKYVSILLPY